MGNDNAQAFIKHCRGTPGWDFGEWLNAQPQKSNDEIEAEIDRAQAEAEQDGIPDYRAMP